MAKMKVHDLAKELDKQSKDIISLLQDKGVEVKSHMSLIEASDVELVKKAFKQHTEKKSSEEMKKLENGKPEVTKEETVKVVAEKKKVVKPKVEKTEAVKPKVVKKEAVATEAVKAKTVKTETEKTGAEKVETVKPKAVKTKAVEVPSVTTEKEPNQAKKKKKIIFVSNPQNSKNPSQVVRSTPSRTIPVTQHKTVEATDTSIVAPKKEDQAIVKETKTVEVSSEQKENGQEKIAVSTKTNDNQTDSPVENTVVEKPQVVEHTQSPSSERNTNTSGGQKPTYTNTSNSGGQRPAYNSSNTSGGQRPAYNSSNTSGGQRPTYNNNNTSGGQRPTYNNTSTSGGQRPPYNNNNTSGGQRPPYNSANSSGGQRPPYNNTNTSGGQRPPYNNTNSSGGQRPPYNNTNSSGGQRPPYNNTNSSGGQRPPYNNTNSSGGQRTYNNTNSSGGQRPPYNNNNTSGGQRPYNNTNSSGGQRPYNNAGSGRPYNNNGGQGGYNNNGGQGGYNKDNYSNEGGNRDNRFQKPVASKPMGTDGPMIQEKRRDEEKRKIGQEKDKRSKRNKIYEEEVALKPGRFIKPEKKFKNPHEELIKVIILPEIITIKDLADKMKIPPAVIVKKLFLQGQVVTLNQEILYEAAEEIAIEYDVICEKEVKIDVIEELLKEEDENEEKMIKRPPVICVMGHVDHGKTSLLDAIRETNVTVREAGGITQHIGAYTVDINGQSITFLDTPGHEAFTSMRMRGANSTDIAILVIAADDGVMPQTVEAINHAKAAGIEIIVAVNKIDKPGANIDKVKQELTEYELVAEDWGGTTVFAPVSAKTGEGIEQLLELILITAEMLELKADVERSARGLVIEAQLDKGRGPVATILVQKGTLHVGDFVAAGACHGKVRAMIDDKGQQVKEAGPSTPVEILGLNDVPKAGEVFIAPSNDKEAKQFADTFISHGREKMLDETKAKMSLDDLFSQIQEGNLKEINLIVKADVQGSVEAVKQSLMKLTNEEIIVKIIHSGVGAINESDIILASASSAIIIGFNVKPDVMAKITADREKVDVRLYKVIYQAIEDIEAAMKGMLDPVYAEKIIGHAEIRQIFKASALGNIAGAYVLDGLFQRNCKVRITRDGKQIFEGGLASLKRFKDDVKEVKAGYECGLVFDDFDQVVELDLVEAYIMVEVPR